MANQGIKFGVNKLGRQKRTVQCTSATLKGCEWMPNFRASQRGCVLKQSNSNLRANRVAKRSQIDAINGDTVSTFDYKKIRKTLDELIKTPGSEFTITFMTAEINLKTVEIFFKGPFCQSVTFKPDNNGNNFIIEDIPYENEGKWLTDKAKLERGYRVTKVKSIKVAGKKYDEIRTILLTASNDVRVDYAVIFEEGDHTTEHPVDDHHSSPSKTDKHLRPKSGKWSKNRSSAKRSSHNIRSGGHKTNRKTSSNHQKSQSFSGVSPSWGSSQSVDSYPEMPQFNLSSMASLKESDTVIVKGPRSRRSSNANASGYDSAPDPEEVAPTTYSATALTTVPTIGATATSPLAVIPAEGFSKNKTNSTGNTTIPLMTQIKTNVVNVLCDECKKVFMIDETELKYHCIPVDDTKDSKDSNSNHLRKISSLDIGTSALIHTPEIEEEDNKTKITMELSETLLTPDIEGDIISPDSNSMNSINSVHSGNSNHSNTSSFGFEATPTPTIFPITSIEPGTPHTPTPSPVPVVPDNGGSVKYNGLCSRCVQMECTVELLKLNTVQLAPCLSGMGVVILHHPPGMNGDIRYIDDDEDGNEHVSDLNTGNIDDGMNGDGNINNTIKRRGGISPIDIITVTVSVESEDGQSITGNTNTNTRSTATQNMKHLKDLKDSKDSNLMILKEKEDQNQNNTILDSVTINQHDDKSRNSNHRRIRRIERDSLRDYKILVIGDQNVEHWSFQEIMGMYYNLISNTNKIQLKLKKHFRGNHLQIVTAYHLHQKEMKLQEEANRKRVKVEDSESDSDSDFEEAPSRPSSARRQRRRPRSTSVGMRAHQMRRKKKSQMRKNKKVKLGAPTNSADGFDSDGGGTTAYDTSTGNHNNRKSVEQMIDEHEGMGYIREAMTLEQDGQWEEAAIRYQKGIDLLHEWQKEVELPSRKKRELRNEVRRLRSKMLNLQNRLARGGRGKMLRDPPHSKSSRDSNHSRKDSKDSPSNRDRETTEDNKDGGKGDKDKNKKDPDKEFRDRLMGDIITEAPDISFKDVTGLMNVKLALYENVILPQLRPELFTGLRKPSAGLLLFGPPGNGKTMIAKCVATECDATFFSISASSITSKYVGEAERIMRTLFNLAREKEPSIIFIDEIDSLLTARGGNNEAESSRRIKTEFLVQFDGVKASADGKEARVLVIGATNLPEQLDEAVLRRFGKRILVPVPDDDARYGILRNLAAKQTHVLREQDFRKIVSRTNLYSASDLTNLSKDAAMGPLRDLGAAVLDLGSQLEVPPVQLQHYESALKNVRASVKEQSLHAYRKWDSKFGSKLTFELSSLPENMHAHPIEEIQ